MAAALLRAARTHPLESGRTMWSALFSEADTLPSLRLVKTAGGQMEALIVKSRLEAEGIPVHLRYEAAGSLYGFRATGLGRVDILVPEAFAEAARIACGEAGRPKNLPIFGDPEAGGPPHPGDAA